MFFLYNTHTYRSWYRNADTLTSFIYYRSSYFGAHSFKEIKRNRYTKCLQNVSILLYETHTNKQTKKFFFHDYVCIPGTCCSQKLSSLYYLEMCLFIFMPFSQEKTNFMYTYIIYYKWACCFPFIISLVYVCTV